jgi:fumarate hydratase class II
MNAQLLTMINRVLSLAIAVTSIILAGIESGFNLNIFIPIIIYILILSLIWFGDSLGSFTGYVGQGGNIDNESPGWLVCAFGWLLLIGIPACVYLTNRG